jgi:hypothetical protein
VGRPTFYFPHWPRGATKVAYRRLANPLLRFPDGMWVSVNQGSGFHFTFVVGVENGRPEVLGVTVDPGQGGLTNTALRGIPKSMLEAVIDAAAQETVMCGRVYVPEPTPEGHSAQMNAVRCGVMAFYRSRTELTQVAEIQQSHHNPRDAIARSRVLSKKQATRQLNAVREIPTVKDLPRTIVVTLGRPPLCLLPCPN